MYRIDIQKITKQPVPKLSLLRTWAKKALEKQIKAGELTIRIVDTEEMSELNTHYRQKQGPTNVLSFPLDMPHGGRSKLRLLGDIVICAAVVDREAHEQQKTLEAHWAHMIIHGIFHLLGFNHETEDEALEMESLETELMQQLGFTDPYQLTKDIIHD